MRDSLVDAAIGPFRAAKAAWNGQRQRDPETTTWALRDFGCDIKRGESVAIIGRNGAGKSTLLKILSRITEPSSGFAEIHGRVGSLLEVGTGFHNELSGRENIYLNGAILGMRKGEIEQKFDEIVAFAEVEKFIDTPVKHYSSGMYLRLAFAVAAHLEPEVLLVDEVLAVGDTVFQAKCLGKADEVAKQGRTVVFVSHNMGAVRSLCQKGIVLNEGMLHSSSDVSSAIESYYRLVGALRTRDQTEMDERRTSGFGEVVLNNGLESAVGQSAPFVVTTTLKVPEGVSGFQIKCVLDDMHSRRIFHLTKTSVELKVSGLQPGAYDVSVTCPPLWLNAGLYSLYFYAIFDGGYGSSSEYSDRIPIDVSGVAGKNGQLLYPAGEWTFSKQ